MNLEYFGFLAGVGVFFGAVVLWLRHQSHVLDRKYPQLHPPAGE